MKRLPLLLVPLAVAWLAGARGVALAPWVTWLTAAVVAVLAARAVVRGVRVGPELLWLLGLVAWSAAASAIRPVAVGAAAWYVAAGVVAMLLVLVSGTPRGAVSGRLAVVGAGTLAGGWLLVERLTLGERPGGPFGNPNLAATAALLGLALVPRLRLPAWARAALGVALAAGIVASGSRGALLGALAVAGVWALTGAGRGARRAAVAVIAIAGVGLVARLALDRDPLRFERVRIWAVAGRTVLAELPWGCGPGEFDDAALGHNFPRTGDFARYARTVGVAENDGLELAATLGLPGVLLAAGLVLAVARRLRGSDADGCGVVAALAVTSAVNTQLAMPVLMWLAALAVGSVLPRSRGTPLRAAPALAMALGLAVMVPVAVGLSWPDNGLAADPDALLARCQRSLGQPSATDRSLADDEALAWEATRLRPRDPRGWRTLGAVELRRASLRREAALAEAAVRAFTAARRADRFDAFAALGSGRARRALGDLAGARRDIRAALELEPNFVGAWLELAVVSMESGELAAARHALGSAEAASGRAQQSRFVSAYERALAGADPVLLARLRLALEGRR